jgi:hypothetical protein
VSEEEFWQRYYFCIAEIKLAQQTRADLVENNQAKEEDFSWSSEGEDNEEEVAQAVVDMGLLETKEDGGIIELKTYEPDQGIEESHNNEQVEERLGSEQKDVVTSAFGANVENELTEALLDGVPSAPSLKNKTDLFNTDEIVPESNSNFTSTSSYRPDSDLAVPPEEQHSGSSFDMVETPRISPNTVDIIEKEEEEWGGWD